MLHTSVHMPYVYAHAPVTGASSAHSVPPGDSKAGGHVDKGDQASPSAPPAAPACPVPAPLTLARVGSVPIFAPSTPPDKIHRTHTPSTVAYEANAGNVQAPAAPLGQSKTMQSQHLKNLQATQRRSQRRQRTRGNVED